MHQPNNKLINRKKIFIRIHFNKNPFRIINKGPCQPLQAYQKNQEDLSQLVLKESVKTKH